MATLNHPKAETAHILFLDAVGYSTLPLDRQTAVFRGLQDIVNNSPTVADAASLDEVIRTPTGDGMALVFFDHCSNAIAAPASYRNRSRVDSRSGWVFTPAKSFASSTSMAT
jgi:hypothetical protein